VGLFFKRVIMAEKKDTKKKEVKEYTVKKTSVGTALNFKGEKIILNNGLPQKTLKALFNHGLKSIVKNEK
jgi:hypothetical protein